MRIQLVKLTFSVVLTVLAVVFSGWTSELQAQLSVENRALIEAGIPAEITADHINSIVEQAKESPNNPSRFEAKLVDSYLEGLSGLQMTQKEYEQAIRKSFSAAGVDPDKIKKALATPDAILAVINQQRRLKVKVALSTDLRHRINTFPFLVQDIVEVEQIAGAESVIDFFDEDPYTVNVSKHRFFIVKRFDSQSIGGMLMHSERDPARGSLLSGKMSLQLDGKKYLVDFPFPDVGTFHSFVSSKVFGASTYILIPEKTLHTKTKHRLNGTLVQELQHFYDILSDKNFSDHEYSKKEMKQLEKRYDLFRPELETYYDIAVKSNEFKAWFKMYVRFKFEAEIQRTKGSDVPRGFSPMIAGEHQGVPIDRIDRSIYENWDALNTNFKQNFMDLSKSRFFYLGKTIERKGHKAELKYLMGLGLSFDEACAVFAEPNAATYMGAGALRFELGVPAKACGLC